MFTKDNCTFCKMAKQMIAHTKNTYEEKKIGDGETEVTTEVLQEMVVNAGSPAVVKTAPQIFLGEKYIGGATDLIKYLNSL